MELNELVDRRYKLSKLTLSQKGRGYSKGKDRYHNFYRAAQLKKEHVYKAWLGFVSKHLVVLLDMIEAEEIPNQAWCDEILGDIHNYLHLLEGIISELRGEQFGKMMEEMEEDNSGPSWLRS